MKKNRLIPFLIIINILTASSVLSSCEGRNNTLDLTEDTIEDDPLDTCLTQGDINQYFSRRATQHQDSVMSAFRHYMEQSPSPLLEEELLLWEAYDSTAIEAYKRINMSGSCGSAAPMGLNGFAYDIADQFLASFAYSGKQHMIITDDRVNDAYNRFLSHGIDDDYVENDSFNLYYTLDEKKSSLSSEQIAWNKWMALRRKISSLLKGNEKERYDMRTNEIRRMKLIQLKNQYQWYPLNSDDFFENMLDPDCSEAQLQNYTYLDSVLGNRTE